MQETIQTDSSPIRVKEFNKELSESYTAGDFNYQESRGQSENLLRRFINWFLDIIRDIFGVDIDRDTYDLMETILYISLIAVGLYFMVRLLLGQQATAFFSGNSKTIAPLNVSEEDITQIDLDALINQALSQKDYRLAVRYMYLKVLKQLTFKEIINWHFEKTNSDYYREIESEALKENFEDVSYLYEYVWYGEFPLDAKGFQRAQTLFHTMNTKIDRHG